MKESYNFVDFANSFHPTVGFTVKRNLATIKKINKAGKRKLEGNLHMISLTESYAKLQILLVFIVKKEKLKI